MATKNTITNKHISQVLEKSKKMYQKMGDKTLVCLCTLPNGFEIIENASCVDPLNFSEEIGKKICEERIKNKLWELEGYKLQSKITGDN